MKSFLPALLICFFGFSTAQSQNTLVKGQVLDAVNSQPLAYANLTLKEVSLGTSTNKDGMYGFEVPQKLLDEKVVISYVGYQQTIKTLRELQNARIKMIPNRENLDEVVVSGIMEENRVVIRPDWGMKVVGLGNLNGGLYPSVLARYYEKPKDFEGACYLKQLGIYFYETKDQYEISPKFRLHVYNVAENGGPGKDLLRNYIVEKPFGKNSMKIDLLDEKIQIPKEGFYVGVEHLFIKENQFQEIKDYYINDSLVAKDYAVTKYAPIYRGSLEERNSGSKMYFYHPGGWSRIENWDLSNDFFGNKIPVLEFKIIITD